MKRSNFYRPYEWLGLPVDLPEELQEIAENPPTIPKIIPGMAYGREVISIDSIPYDEHPAAERKPIEDK